MRFIRSKYLFGLLFLFSLSASAQVGVLGVIRPLTRLSFVVFSGESNSGGYAQNSLALAPELGARKNARILNNLSLASFDTLQIGGVNDNTHVLHGGNSNGLWDGAHGWELMLANMADTGYTHQPVYIVKTGQGGSTIANWFDDASYYAAWDSNYHCWPLMKSRIDAAITLLDSSFAIFYSQGINDAIAGTDTATWKAATIAHFAKIRARYGNVPIVMTKFTSGTPNRAAFERQVEQICNEVTNCRWVETSDLEERVDGYHWEYSGMKTLCKRMYQTLRSMGYTL